MKKSAAPEVIEELDWLAMAIVDMGGIQRAAKRMGCSDRTIRNWLARGLGHVEVDTVYNLAKLSKIPVQLLIRRRGPFKGRRTARTR